MGHLGDLSMLQSPDFTPSKLVARLSDNVVSYPRTGSLGPSTCFQRQIEVSYRETLSLKFTFCFRVPDKCRWPASTRVVGRLSCEGVEFDAMSTDQMQLMEDPIKETYMIFWAWVDEED